MSGKVLCKDCKNNDGYWCRLPTGKFNPYDGKELYASYTYESFNSELNCKYFSEKIKKESKPNIFKRIFDRLNCPQGEFNDRT